MDFPDASDGLGAHTASPQKKPWVQTVTRSSEMHSLREEMQEDVAAVSKSADQIKRRLAQLEKANEESLKTKVCML
jgi:hypothetical protein